MKLTRERLVKLRGEGLTYRQIAEVVGCSQALVAGMAKLYLPAGARRNQRKYKRRILELTEERWTPGEVAAEVGLPRWRVRSVLQQVENKKYAEGRRRCGRCGLLEEERNPAGKNGVCLWCRLEGLGVNLLEWHESGAALEMVGELS